MTELPKNDPVDFNLFNFFEAIFRARNVAIAAAIIAALLFIGFIFIFRLAVPTTKTYQQLFQITFPKGNNDLTKITYPNDKIFSPQDLLTPNIINLVYKNNQLEHYGLSKKDFVNSLYIAPYSDFRELIISRYTKRLSNRKLTFIDKKTIENQMKKELENLKQDQFVLSLVFSKEYGIPDNIADKILKGLIREWSSYEVNQQGVLKLPESVAAQLLIDRDLINPETPYITVSYLIDKLTELKNMVNNSAQINGIETVLDEKTGFSLTSLQKTIDDFYLYKIKLLQNKISDLPAVNINTSKRIVQMQIDILGIKYNTFKEKAATVQSQLREYDNRETLNNASQIKTNTPSDAPSKADTNITQLNDGLIASIIRLSEKRKQDIRYRQKLIEKQTAFLDKAANILSIQNQKKLLIKNIAMGVKDKNIEGIGAKAKTEFAGLLNKTVSSLEDYSAVLNRIMDKLSIQKVNYAGTIYRFLNLPSKERKISYHPVINKDIGFLFLLSLFGSMALAILGSLIWQFLSFNKGRNTPS